MLGTHLDEFSWQWTCPLLYVDGAFVVKVPFYVRLVPNLSTYI